MRAESRRSPVDQDNPDVRENLDRLAARLTEAGLHVRIAPSCGKPQNMAVRHPAHASMREVLWCRLDAAGVPSLWWSWGDRLCRVEETETAAAAITRVLHVEQRSSESI